MPKLTGGEAIVHLLRLHGVDHAFGMGGFQTLPYYDAITRQDSLRHILIRDEKHGAFAADAFARVANRPAVADATLGPGATNLVSGAAESFGASIPLILLTGEVNSLIAGRGATQESDQFGMLKPTSKASIRIERIDRVPELIRRAMTIAVSGRPGPVHVDVTEDVMHANHEFPDSDLYADPASTRVGVRKVRPDQDAIDAASAILADARRPLIVVGGGVHLSQAYGELTDLVDATGIPVTYTMSGKGAIDDRHPAVLGLIGRYSRAGNDLIKDADVILVVGCKLGEIATTRWSLLRPTSKLIQIDVDPAEFGKVYRCDVGVWADAGLGLRDLLAALPARQLKTQIAEWTLRAGDVRRKWEEGAEANYRSGEQPIHMARLLRELRRSAPDDSIVVADGGFAAHWSALLYETRLCGRGYIANRGHAAIGYGLPGAIGAKLAAPDRQVIALCGDNGFAMAVAELETAKRAHTPLVAVVVDNAALGYVKALQHSLYSGRYVSADFEAIDYADVARSFGCFGRRVTDPNELPSAFEAAFASGLPAVLDVVTTLDPSRMLPGVDARTIRSD
jgi:acetolactate synthase-1/2/3 large subunit